MCGIMGYFTTGNLSSIDKKYIKQLNLNLLYETAVRGTDATGYLAHYSKYNKSIWYKKAIPSPLFIKQGCVDFKELPDRFVGHTRMATSGNPAYNRNNHPLVRNKFGLMHNGVVTYWNTNHDYKELRRSMCSETDSELFAVYLEQNNHSFKNFRTVFDNASYAIVTMHLDSGNVVMCKDMMRDLAVANLSKTLGIVLFASTACLINRAMEATFKEFPEYRVDQIDAYTVYEATEEGLKEKYKIKQPNKIKGINKKEYLWSQNNVNNYNDYEPDAWDDHYNFEDFKPIGNTSKPDTSSMISDAINELERKHDSVIACLPLILVDRVDSEIVDHFKNWYGEKNYMYFLRKFAGTYYHNKTNYKTRTAYTSLKLAEAWMGSQNDYSKYSTEEQ